MKKGLPVVISAPSGGGKSTIVAAALNVLPHAVRSVSWTTRPPRPGERNGRDYFFVTAAEFKRRVRKRDFLEWASVHNHFYGTPLAAFKRKLNQGFDVFLTIDPQGAVSIRNIFPKAVFIFVMPPTWSVLLKRLKNRGTDSKLDLQTRLKNAQKEIRMRSQYDYLVINNHLTNAVQDVVAILRAEHLSLRHTSHLSHPILK